MQNMLDEERNLPATTVIPSVTVYSQIPLPSPMNTKGNLANNWKYFKKSWNNYKLAKGLDKKDKAAVLATLYTVLGREANQIAENLEVSDPADPESLIEALSNYFEPQKNIIFERYLSPSRRREAPCEGTNSPRLFTPVETKALAKSKVHQ